MILLNFLEKSVDYYFSCFPRKKPDRWAISQARLIAHRGAHDKHTIIENTDAAFARALRLGCWGIELDIHETADNVLMVNHDPNLYRLWGKKAAINELTFHALHQLAPELPSLAEVVERYGKRIHLFIELKSSCAEVNLIEVLQPLTPCVDYHLLSLKESFFSSFSELPREAMLLVAVHNNVRKFCNLSQQKHYGGVLSHYFLLNNNKLRQMQKAKNQMIGVGFIDSKFGLYRELNRGVYWLFSNNVALLSTCLRNLQENQGLSEM